MAVDQDVELGSPAPRSSRSLEVLDDTGGFLRRGSSLPSLLRGTEQRVGAGWMRFFVTLLAVGQLEASC